MSHLPKSNNTDIQRIRYPLYGTCFTSYSYLKYIYFFHVSMALEYHKSRPIIPSQRQKGHIFCFPSPNQNSPSTLFSYSDCPFASVANGKHTCGISAISVA